MKTPLIDTINELAVSVIEDTDMFLVDLEIKGSDSNPIIWIYVDTQEGGVNIDQCAKVSKQLVFLVESHEVITGKFTLNVSSPGLDRPLKDRRQYAKNTGRKAAVVHSVDGESKKLNGVLVEVRESGIVLEADKGKRHEITWDDLAETKILPAFK